jgi:hypothetical protein
MHDALKATYLVAGLIITNILFFHRFASPHHQWTQVDNVTGF